MSNQSDRNSVASCSTAFSHRITFFLEGGDSVSTDTNAPDVCRQEIQQGLDGYYRRWWQRRDKTSFSLEGESQVVIPIAKVQCFKVEPIRR